MEVTVGIVRARVPHSTFLFTTSKYRVEILHKGEVYRTQEVKGSSELVWKEGFKLEADMKDVIEVKIRENMMFGGLRDVGRTEVKVETALEKGEGWWTLGKDTALHLQVTSSSLRDSYLHRIFEIDLQKQEIRSLKHKYLSKISKSKQQKRACQRRYRELEASLAGISLETGTNTPNFLPSEELERKREHLSTGEEQLLKEKLALQMEKEELQREEMELIRLKEGIAAERRKMRLEKCSPETKTASLSKENCLQNGLKTPQTSEKGLKTPLSKRLLMTTSSNRLLSFV